MRAPSSQDQEAALDALFRKARTEPCPEHVLRVKQQLHALAREVETPRGRSGNGAIAACLAVGVAGLSLGLGVLLGPRESSAGFGASSPEPVVVAAPVASLEAPEIRDAVPVEDLAPAEEAPLAEPASVVASAPKTAQPGEQRPAIARTEPAKTIVAEPRVNVEASHEATTTTKTADDEPAGASAATTDEAARKEGEASFLRRAKVALPTDPARALRLTDEHPTVYPRGVLLQEREVIAIEALIRLGRTDDARARAASFRSRYPSSVYHGHLDDRIERLLNSTNDARR